MANEEIKIKVSAQADNKDLDSTKAKIQELYKAAASYESKGIETAAKSARSDARELERDLARSSRERASAEKEITREHRDQARSLEQSERSSQRFLTRAAGIGGSAAVAGAGMLAEDYYGRKTIDAQADASRAINARQVSIMSGWRGGSGALQSIGFSAQDQEFALKQQRAEIESQTKGSMVQQGLIGAAGGAATGAMFGPLGAIVGSLLGAGGGALRAYLGGNRNLKENEAAQLTAKEQSDAAMKAANERFSKGEGGIEMEMLRNQSQRSMTGQRGAFVDQKLLEWANAYKQMRDQGASDAIANEAANLSVGNTIRDTQAKAGMSLVGARSGAAESAAAAQWGMKAFPGMGELADRIDALHSTVRGGYESSQLKDLAK